MEEDWLCAGEKRRYKDNLLIPLSRQCKSSVGLPGRSLARANPHILTSAKVSHDGPEIYDFVYDFLSIELPLYFKKNTETQWQLMNHFSEIACWM